MPGTRLPFFPSFVMERAQSVALLVMRARAEGRIPRKTPLFMAGLADSMTAFHTEALGLDIEYTPVALHEWIPSMQAIRAAVIIAGSGMLSCGSGAARLAELLLPDKRRNHAIIFPGYCTPASPAGRLLASREYSIDGHSHAWLNGRIVDVRSGEIHQAHLSCHANARELVTIIKALGARAAVLVHGDGHALDTLAGALRDEFGRGYPVHIPQNGESYSCSGRPAESLSPDESSPERALARNPWDIQAMQALSAQSQNMRENLLPRMRAVFRLLMEHALRDGRLVRACELLHTSDGLLPEDERIEILRRIDDISYWCPQNDT